MALHILNLQVHNDFVSTILTEILPDTFLKSVTVKITGIPKNPQYFLSVTDPKIGGIWSRQR